MRTTPCLSAVMTDQMNLRVQTSLTRCGVAGGLV